MKFALEEYLHLTDYKFATWRQTLVEFLQELTKNCPHLPDLLTNLHTLTLTHMGITEELVYDVLTELIE